MKKSLLCLFLFTLMLSGCSIYAASSKKDELFVALYPEIPMNEGLKLEIINSSINRKKIGDMVYLVLTNEAEKTMLFSKDFGVQIWKYDVANEEWLNITNNMEYAPDEPRILQPNSNDAKIVIVNPANLEKSEIFIRIVVLGNVYENAEITEKVVGAYTDIVLHP